MVITSLVSYQMLNRHVYSVKHANKMWSSLKINALELSFCSIIL